MSTADAQTQFSVDYSKRLSKCKRCRQEISKGSIRIAKLVPNIFAGGDDENAEMKQFYHVKCMFESFNRARASTKKIEAVDDIQNFTKINDEDKQAILDLIDGRKFQLFFSS
jgi:DNA ligase 3